MLSVDYHWDKLDTCVVGRCYPPEFFSFIKNSKIRNAIETVASETIEDLTNLIRLLESFDVKVLQPELENSIDNYIIGNTILPPPLTPRDHLAAIGSKIYMPTTNRYGKWNRLRGSSWPMEPPKSDSEFRNLDQKIKKELVDTWQISRVDDIYDYDFTSYKNIETYVKHTNSVVYDQDINTAMVLRLGQDLYFGTWPWQTKKDVLDRVSPLFPDYRCHVIDSQGHLDGCICIVSPSLVFTTKHVLESEIRSLFPDAEIYELPLKEFLNRNFQQLKKQNQGKWWVKGQENNSELTDFVNLYLKSWMGFIEETVIDVNMLHVDKNNVICIGEDSKLIKKLNSHGITAHPIAFRHLYFWDSGVHCLTNDLSRVKQ